MTKKPDRFEFMPDKVGIKQEDDAGVHRAVLGLLRRQHAAYVRIVKRELKTARYMSECNGSVQHITCEYILYALTRYKKGMP